MVKELLIPRKYEHKIRLGKKQDGGYVVSKNHLPKNLISVGCENQTSFELDYLNLVPDSKIHIFDDVVSSPDLANKDERVSFTKKFVSTFSDLNIDKPCIVQMDIEGAEVRLFGESDLSGIEMIEQLVIEFHFHKRMWPLFPQNGPDEKIEKALRVLNQHFTLIHIHINNCGLTDGWPMYKDLYDPIELTYIKKDDSLPIETEKFPIEGLDFPNRPGAFDPIIDWWIK